MCLARSARARYEVYLIGRKLDELEKEKLEAEKKDAELAVQDLVQRKQKIAELESEILQKKRWLNRRKKSVILL